MKIYTHTISGKMQADDSTASAFCQSSPDCAVSDTVSTRIVAELSLSWLGCDELRDHALSTDSYF